MHPTFRWVAMLAALCAITTHGIALRARCEIPRGSSFIQGVKCYPRVI